MTAGGARTNYEAGLDLELNRSDADDEAMLQAVNDWVDDLLADTAVCLRLDAGLLVKLIADSRYRIGDEDAPKPGSKKPEDSDSVVEDGPSAGPGLFGKSKYPLKSSSASPTVGSSGPSGGSSAPPAPPPAGTGPAPASGTSAAVVKRWYEQLKAADAQQLGGTSNPSGHVTLVNAGHAIDKRVYFRHDFFGAETWKPQGAKNEVCTIVADVVIDGKPMGTRSFTIQHTPAFEAGQGNRSTVLHWDSLSSQMKAISHVNKYLTLERLASGGYRITIAPSQVGPFIK